MSQYPKQECEELHANSIISFDSRGPKTQDPELVACALRVLLQQPGNEARAVLVAQPYPQPKFL
jgi:hypothetical protein